MRTLKLSLALIATLCLAPAANADLILSVNTADKTFALLGSDTGTTGLVGGRNQASFQVNASQTEANSEVTYNNDVAFSTTLGTPGSSIGQDIRVLAGFGVVRVDLLITEGGMTTLSGTGVYQSYAGLTDVAMFESVIGSQLAVAAGTGFSAMSVQAVPEPSSCLFVGLMSLGLFGRFGRERFRDVTES